MSSISADRRFFYLMLFLVAVVTLILIWQYLGAVVLAITTSVILQPMHHRFMRSTGQRKGLATALTLLSTLLLVIIPALVGLWLLFDSLAALSNDVADIMQAQDNFWVLQAQRFEQWLQSAGVAERLRLEPGQLTQVVRGLLTEMGTAFVRRLAAAGLYIAKLVLPTVVFVSLLGTLLTNEGKAVQLYKDLSPLDDGIDQLFLDRMRIMTRSMMLSIVVVAVVQGSVTGILMAITGTPHIIPLTIASMIMAILPGGAAIIAVPVGIAHILVGNVWAGLIVIGGTLTFVASLANQIRPRLVSKEAYLNRAFVLLSVFSGVALLGTMGIVYGPLIMILFTTILEVYLQYYRPGPPEVTIENTGDAPSVEASEKGGDEVNP